MITSEIKGCTWWLVTQWLGGWLFIGWFGWWGSPFARPPFLFSRSVAVEWAYMWRCSGTREGASIQICLRGQGPRKVFPFTPSIVFLRKMPQMTKVKVKNPDFAACQGVFVLSPIPLLPRSHTAIFLVFSFHYLVRFWYWSQNVISRCKMEVWRVYISLPRSERIESVCATVVKWWMAPQMLLKF